MLTRAPPPEYPDTDPETRWCFDSEARDQLVYPGVLLELEGGEARPVAARYLLDLTLRFGQYRFDGTVFGLGLYLWDRGWLAGGVVDPADVRLSSGACFVLAARYEALLGDTARDLLFVLQALGWPATDPRALVGAMNRVLATAKVPHGTPSVCRVHLLRVVYAHKTIVPQACMRACLYIGMCCQLNLELLRRYRTADLALAACALGCALEGHETGTLPSRLYVTEILDIGRLFVRGRPIAHELVNRAFPYYARLSDEFYVQRLGLSK